MQNKLKHSYNKKLFGKDHTDPDIKPYSVSLSTLSISIIFILLIKIVYLIQIIRNYHLYAYVVLSNILIFNIKIICYDQSIIKLNALEIDCINFDF